MITDPRPLGGTSHRAFGNWHVFEDAWLRAKQMRRLTAELLPDYRQFAAEVATHCRTGNLPIESWDDLSDMGMYQIMEGRCTMARDILLIYLNNIAEDHPFFPAYGHFLGYDVREKNGRRAGANQHGWLQAQVDGYTVILDPTAWIFASPLPGAAKAEFFLSIDPVNAANYDLGGFRVNGHPMVRRNEMMEMDPPPLQLHGMSVELGEQLDEIFGFTSWREGVYMEEIQSLCHLNPLLLSRVAIRELHRILGLSGFGAQIPLDFKRFVEHGHMSLASEYEGFKFNVLEVAP